MAVQVPTPDQIKDVADEIGLNVTEADVASYIELMRGTVEAYNVVDAMPDNLPQVSYARTPGYRPGAAENKYNAWHVKTTVNGAARGKLKGKTIVLKDNIMLAGVPMMNGAATLQGYVPEIDATVVTRILDAGGTIVGKAHCESFCLSGGSHTNATGPVHNPHKMGYSAGGSSSGSAALVAAKEVDMAMGGDQGGSIRMPASYCGVYGMKATHGLVPYTGIMPIEIYVDHTGPMTNTVEDNALLLEVIAGEDGYDPRQYNVKTQRYTKALQGAKGIKGMKIAVVKEGYQAENAEKDVNTKVRAAAKKLQAMGAKVKEVSIPMHPLGGALWMPIGIEGLTQTMMHGDGYGLSRPDLYITSLMDKHREWRQRADEMSETTKLFTLFGTYINKQHGSRYYGKAMNITRLLTAAYDAVLADYDLLLMPTTPIKATRLPAPDASRE
ncbi:MAG: amidase, partial [Alphaproteobacteria bacterium]|nr:amidase [Alphaproteobacteria bacterium]